MRKRRKTNDCLNCGYPLKPEFDYCPKCGQENHITTISFGALVKDFFDNYFSLDSRFGRSIKPFFTKPGTLTAEFMAGKRMSYANPVRLYLVVSLIHFFILNIYINKDDGEGKKKGIINVNENAPDENAGSPIRFNLKEDSSQVADTLTVEEDEEEWPLTGEEFLLVKELSESGKYSNQEILDTLKAGEKPFVQRYVIKQIVKMQGAEQTSIRDLILSNIPLMMFILLPVYALILKMFFSKRLYIMHLIHSLHVHSFAFMVLSVMWLIATLWEDPMGWVVPLSFLICLLYVMLSYKKVYEVRWFTTIFKVFISGFVYFTVLIVGLLVEILLSFLFY